MFQNDVAAFAESWNLDFGTGLNELDKQMTHLNVNGTYLSFDFASLAFRINFHKTLEKILKI